jgi:membrane protein
MKNFLSSVYTLFKTTLMKWWAHDPLQAGAALAYSAIFALPGLLVIIITLAGYFLGNDLVSGRLNAEIASVMGKNTADQVQQMVSFAARSRGSFLASMIGVVVILTGAIGVFVQMQKIFNEIWEVKAEKKKSGLMSFLKSRLFSFGLILSIAFC